MLLEQLLVLEDAKLAVAGCSGLAVLKIRRSLVTSDSIVLAEQHGKHSLMTSGSTVEQHGKRSLMMIDSTGLAEQHAMRSLTMIDSTVEQLGKRSLMIADNIAELELLNSLNS